MILEFSQIINILIRLTIHVWTRLYMIYSRIWLGTVWKKSRYERTLLPAFTRRTRIHDLALVVEKRELWYSRQTLCLHSTYFNRLLNPSKGSASNSDRVPLHGLSYNDVLRLLWCLTPGETFMRVDMSNVVSLGVAANELEIGEVRKRCEQFLTQQSLNLSKDGDPRVMDLLVSVSRLGYRPLLDYLICKTAEMMSFKQIKRRCNVLPPAVLAALYDLKLRGYTRWCHEWHYTLSVKPDEFCDCGEEPFDTAHRCGKCNKICCDNCYASNGLGAVNRCNRCGECGGVMDQSIRGLRTSAKRRSPYYDLCRCRPASCMLEDCA